MPSLETRSQKIHALLVSAEMQFKIQNSYTVFCAIKMTGVGISVTGVVSQ